MKKNEHYIIEKKSSKYCNPPLRILFSTMLAGGVLFFFVGFLFFLLNQTFICIFCGGTIYIHISFSFRHNFFYKNFLARFFIEGKMLSVFGSASDKDFSILSFYIITFSLFSFSYLSLLSFSSLSLFFFLFFLSDKSL